MKLGSATITTICDPVSKNPAHCAFYENRDKTGNWYTNVYGRREMEAIGCLVPKLQSEMCNGSEIWEHIAIWTAGTCSSKNAVHKLPVRI